MRTTNIKGDDYFGDRPCLPPEAYFRMFQPQPRKETLGQKLMGLARRILGLS